MLCLRATLPASLRALASFLEADVGTTARAFMLPGLYFTQPVTSHPSTCDSECGHAGGVSMQHLVPSRN